MDGFTVCRERLVVTWRAFCFAARRDVDALYADYDVETADVDIEAFLAAFSDPAGKVPNGWAWHDGRLFVTSAARNVSAADLIESFEQAKADSASAS